MMNASVSFTESDQERLNNRKRKCRVSEWKDKQRKTLKDSGKPYISNRGKGKLIPAKEVQSNARGCTLTCRKTGCGNLTLEVVHTLHKRFYELSYNEQTLFLLKFVNIREPNYRRPGKTDATSRKQASFDYNINSEPICLKTLLHTFSISARRIQCLQSKIKDGQIAPKDQRGLHLNRPNALDNDVRQVIRDHIKSFPATISHYSRNVSSKQCLSSDLSLKKMYDLFCSQHQGIRVSMTIYRKIFITEFNLRFGTPRSDTCRVCDQFYAKLVLADTEDMRNQVQFESTTHHRKADLAYQTLAADSENKNFIVLCVDLQQVLFTPTLTHSNMYYQRQYTSYNFAVHNMTTQEASMFLWHEVIAKRGSKEIASCLLKYVVSNFTPLKPNEERKLIIWSDRCVGQNNNWTTINLYGYLIRCKYFSEIHQKFLISGHSFLPCDRDFALIKRRKKKTKAMIPSDWKYVIGSSKLNKPFIITEMSQEDFKNLDYISRGFKKNNLKITNFVWLKITSDDPSTVYVRNSHNVLKPWQSYRVFPNDMSKQNYSEIPELYSKLLPITKEKKKDLLDMAKYLTNEEHRLFYQNLPSA